MKPRSLKTIPRAVSSRANKIRNNSGKCAREVNASHELQIRDRFGGKTDNADKISGIHTFASVIAPLIVLGLYRENEEGNSFPNTLQASW